MRLSRLRAVDKRNMLVVFLVTSCVYLNSLGSPFQYDDFHSIADNPHIRALKNVPRFFSDPTLFSEREESAMFRPLLLTTFAINHAISGCETWSYHVLNLALHGVCALLVFGVGKSLLRDRRAALLAALLFGLHPANSEAVNYISSRSEILAAFFFLIAFLLAANRNAKPGNIAGVGLTYAAGLLSKSIVFVLPAVLWARDSLVGTGRSRIQRVLMYGALVAIAAGYLALVWKFVHRAGLGAPVRSLQEQICTQIKALIFYLKLLVMPTGLSVDHQFLISDSPFDPISAPASLFVLSLVLMAVRAAGAQPHYLFSLAWFGIILAPSSLIPLNVLVNEHRLYLPSVSFALLAGSTLGGLPIGSAAMNRFWGATTILLLCLLGLLTIQRNTVWTSAHALWKDAASKAPLMARPHIFLGETHFERGELNAAREAFEIVLVRDPGFGPAYVRLAEIHRAQSNAAEAVNVAELGVATMARNADLWESLGEQHRQDRNFEASRDAYLRAVQLEPEDAGLRNNLGNLYQLLNNPSEALIQHLKAIRVAPADPRSWLNAGNAHQMMRSYDDAESAYSEAVRLNPSYAEAWLNMGGMYARLGRNEDASRAQNRAAAIQANPTSKRSRQR